MTGQAWYFTGVPEIWTEDSGVLMSAQLALDGLYPDGLYVRFTSVKDQREGHEVEQLRGKLVRITVEILDD